MATTEQLYQNQKINLLGGSSREIYCEIEIMASSVIHSSAVSAQTPGIFTVKEFQLKDGIGPWMTRVRIAQMWHELDFMKTNDVTSLDLLLIDYDAMNYMQLSEKKSSGSLSLYCKKVCCWVSTTSFFLLKKRCLAPLKTSTVLILIGTLLSLRYRPHPSSYLAISLVSQSLKYFQVIAITPTLMRGIN